jgi:hypothetical protein
MPDSGNDGEYQVTVTVSRLAWEMAQWELHYLRGLFGTLISEDILHARRGKHLRHHYEEACLRALRDSRYRNAGSSPQPPGAASETSSDS